MTDEINALLWAVTKYFFEGNREVSLIEETRTVKVYIGATKLFTGAHLGRNEYSIDDASLPKSGRHTISGTLAKNILNEINWRGIPESGAMSVVSGEPTFDRCTIGFYRIIVKRSFFESDSYHEFVGVTSDGRRLDDECCRQIMERSVDRVSVNGQTIGERDRHLKHPSSHQLDGFVGTSQYVDKSRALADGDYAVEIERLDYRCMEEKLKLEIELSQLRQRLRRIEKETSESGTPLERLNAKKNKAKTMQELKAQERSLFRDKMVIEKKYEDAKAELGSKTELEAKVIRLFLLDVVVQSPSTIN
jgi:hypothetical protein